MSNEDVNIDLNKDKQITKADEGQGLSDLSSKQKDFIEKLLATGKTYDSYLRSGYTGSYKAAYELRRRLLPWITELSGCTATEVFKALRELSDLPITDFEVTFKDKLELAKVRAKLAGMNKDDDVKVRKNYSHLIIQRFDGHGRETKDVMDTTATNDKDK